MRVIFEDPWKLCPEKVVMFLNNFPPKNSVGVKSPFHFCQKCFFGGWILPDIIFNGLKWWDSSTSWWCWRDCSLKGDIHCSPPSVPFTTRMTWIFFEDREWGGGSKLLQPSDSVEIFGACRSTHVGVSKHGVPQNGWFARKTLLKWMIWGYHHFRKPPCNSWEK